VSDVAKKKTDEQHDAEVHALPAAAQPEVETRVSTSARTEPRHYSGSGVSLGVGEPDRGFRISDGFISPLDLVASGLLPADPPLIRRHDPPDLTHGGRGRSAQASLTS
jgi:hypothetical protein